VGLPLELPAGLLPAVLEQLRAAFPLTRVDVSHDSSAAQLAALREDELDVALVREHPADPVFDAVLAVEEDLGVVLTASRASELAGAEGVRLHQLADLDWVGFPRSGTRSSGGRGRPGRPVPVGGISPPSSRRST
jgi:DNA-binding transcriptional LysR family regulator